MLEDALDQLYDGHCQLNTNAADSWRPAPAELAVEQPGERHAELVGTHMAGLSAAVGRIRLPNSGISVQLSTEPVYTLDGRPRDALRPDVAVDPLALGGEDPWLEAALRRIR